MIDTQRVSRFLSYILRHKPEKGNITLDKNGYASVESVIDAVRANVDRVFNNADLDYVVETNSKKRYEFDMTGTKIRACQGHSVGVNLALKPQIPPMMLFHGTSKAFVPSIRKSGLEKRNRDHVHLSAEWDTAQDVGKRRGPAVVLSIDAKAMLRDGFQFYCSTNGVWLTDHVPSRYILP